MMAPVMVPGSGSVDEKKACTEMARYGVEQHAGTLVRVFVHGGRLKWH